MHSPTERETILTAATPQSIELAGQLLREGQLVGLPTETVYGLAANALLPEAVTEIFKVKGRPQDNPLIVHIADVNDIYLLVEDFPESARKLAERFWPGPLTIIMRKSGLIPSEVTCGQSTVAIRFPSHPTAIAVISAAGVPIAAPSANISGRPSPTTAEHVMSDIGGKIPLIIDGGACDIGVESTVITVVGEKPCLLRPGAVTKRQIEAVIGEIDLSPAVLSELERGEEAQSPGMKYRHYSPSAKVTLVRGSLAAFSEFLESNASDGTYALAFEGDETQLPVPCITYGREGDFSSQAHELFSALRKADELDARRIFARYPEGGEGLAVLNRLLRSAGFDVIEL
ncbi:MAG: threonylcarbamoyl-AMP synthase [Oscillospiraceae bacterium]|jgi:L-threonylcarbamoyladenylate synthase|nr:threonylcarbamoyl-AMP synthase [Oscillospiraceae bacterium]